MLLGSAAPLAARAARLRALWLENYPRFPLFLPAGFLFASGTNLPASRQAAGRAILP